MTNDEFVLQISKYITKYAPKYNIKCPSAVIAQAILESGYGQSSLAKLANNFFGIKTGDWNGPSIVMKTQEEVSGQLIEISDSFRKYSSMEEGVKGYFDVISIERYRNLGGIKDPKTYLTTICNDGYCTDSKYVDKCLKIINQRDLTKYDKSGSKTMSKAEAAIQWMIDLAANDSHGYDQIYRWGEKGDYDCSSAVISAWEKAGVPVRSKYGATYTGNMYKAFTTAGFMDVTNKVDRITGKGLVRGDVLLNHIHHTAMYAGNSKEVEASINERGTATGGKPGDQTGKEILIRAYRNYPWDCVLRWPESSKSAESSAKEDNGMDQTTWKKIQAATYTDAEHARNLADKLSANGIPSYWYRKNQYYFVGCGSYPLESAKKILKKLERLGITGMLW